MLERMKITKLEHACLDIGSDEDRLIIDPGAFAASLVDLSGITAVVITHVHQDHFDEEKVKRILAQNPDVQIFTTQQVADKLSSPLVTAAVTGKQYVAGAFSLEFFGGRHDYIYDELQIPQDQNYGVLINDTLYYPGDSFSPCPKPHTVLAVPSSAPWMKLEEARAFMEADSATTVFPTHYGYVNEAGMSLTNNLLSMRAEAAGKTYAFLKPGESLEV
jgi:L-ascorbate metabolism protein UlaG (beta-lactamase superfamily)